MNPIQHEIDSLEDHIQGYINDSISIMGYEFFGDDYDWESEKEVKGMRCKIAELEKHLKRWA